MNRISLLKNPIQEYAWGSRTAIQSLLQMPVPGKKPAAELWMGVHPKGPSEVWINDRWVPLADVIEKNPVAVLGKKVAERFHNQLPFLFKVLAADRPLSIQVHPNAAQARKGYARENEQGIPLTADERNYRDSNHKPEALCAITPFEALKGFRSLKEIIGLMSCLRIPELDEPLRLLKMEGSPDGLKKLFSGLLHLRGKEKARIIRQAVNCAQEYASGERAFHWMVELNREYPEDTGVFSPLLFNLVTLQPGEAVYIPAGELHAYLKGVGVEVMANSDNVLRGGLTPKHVDLGELLNIVHFAPCRTLRIRPEIRANGECVYPTPAKEFQLSAISVSSGRPFHAAGGGTGDRNVEILLCMEGDAQIQDMSGGSSIGLVSGTSVIVPACAAPYRIQGNARFFKTTVKGADPK